MTANNKQVLVFMWDIIKFIPIVGLVYFILLMVTGYTLPFSIKKNINYRIGAFGHSYSRLEEVKDFGNVDVLFIGSSHTMRGFDTRIFEDYGIRAFNLGTSSQTPIQSKLLLDRYLGSLNPELVIMDVYPKVFENDGLESTLDILSNDVADDRMFDIVVDLNHIKSWHTYIFKKVSVFLGLYEGFTEDKVKGEDTYINGGFIEKRIKYYRYEQPDNSHKWHIDKQQLSAFESILSELEKREIEVNLVYTPITKGMYNSFEDQHKIDSLFSSYGSYYNFNELIVLDDSLDFYDKDHLNQNGVIKFNQALINQLFSLNK